ncbi:MAG: hypothetical protein LBI10_03845 [Deltaproteobacteria bacterium]|nr:hypothetical protein [Deltaproteobacteria bacterium]
MEELLDLISQGEYSFYKIKYLKIRAELAKYNAVIAKYKAEIAKLKVEAAELKAEAAESEVEQAERKAIIYKANFADFEVQLAKTAELKATKEVAELKAAKEEIITFK